MRRSLFACLLLAAFSPASRAEPVLVVPAQFTGPAAPGSLYSPLSAGAVEARLLSAGRALSTGFPSIAADLYAEVLASNSLAAADEAPVRVAYASALMEDGQLDRARMILDQQAPPRNASWRLRSALLYAKQRHNDQVRAELNGLKLEDFSAAERGWFLFLQGVLADAAGNFDQGRDFYSKAIASAETPLAAVRFSLAREQGFLWRGGANLDVLKKNADNYQGKKMGFEASRQLAIGYYNQGQKELALQVLQRLLQSLPASERYEIDEDQLILGLIGGATQGSVGRNFLFALLEDGRDEERQRMALHLLSTASSKDAHDPALEEFKSHLDGLIARQPVSPILESLLYYRAEVALVQGRDAEAVQNARRLIDSFPASPLRVQAYGVLVNAAWMRGRYRGAADFATKARELVSDKVFASRLGVMVAEAWYRARDYRNAADAYAAVMRTPPPGVRPGVLMFQRVQSEIDAGGDLSVAAAQLDELGRDPAFDHDNRWQAEWNLAHALQAARKDSLAYARVSKLLAPGSALPEDGVLRARMALLEIQLALDSGEAAQAIAKAEALRPLLEPLDASLKQELSGAAALVVAQSQFALGRASEALGSLEHLRNGSPGSPAAIYSLIVEAEYYEKQNRPVDAQSSLVALSEQYPKSQYAAYALYRAALLSEQSGQISGLRNANRLIELLIRDHRDSALFFYARLRQGVILSKLNDFAVAQRAYEELINNFPAHADIASALMALADCHAAQSGSSSNHADQAMQGYMELVGHPQAGPDLRAEAGYKYGAALRRNGKPSQAAEVWKRDVVDEQLLKAENAAALGATGRYWVARTLLDLSELLAASGRTDESRRALRLLAESAITADYAELAQSRLSGTSPVSVTVPIK